MFDDKTVIPRSKNALYKEIRLLSTITIAKNHYKYSQTSTFQGKDKNSSNQKRHD